MGLRRLSRRASYIAALSAPCRSGQVPGASGTRGPRGSPAATADGIAMDYCEHCRGASHGACRKGLPGLLSWRLARLLVWDTP